MWTRFLLAFITASGLRAQEDPADLLRLVQARVTNSLDRLPNYMCTQTIDRAQYQPDVPGRSIACDEGPERPSIHLTASDRLRFDVSVTSTDEMYAWVGESRFDDRDLVDIVTDGAISTGSYAAFLSAIFASDEASFTYNGETIQDGQTLSEYGFRVPHEKSRYFFRGDGEHRVITGYDGTFLVNPKTADLVRLAVRTSQLPSETGVCYSSTTLDYARIHLKDTDFLLPSASVMRSFSRDGSIAVNHTAFSSCHEFFGESTLTFDPPANVLGREERHGPVSQALIIPRGLQFRVALTQGIDTASAAAGDPIKAKLITPIRDHSKVLVPTDAAITARIVRIRQFYGGSSSVLLLVKLESVEVAGVSMRLTATPFTVHSFQQAKRGTLQRRVELGTLRSLEDRSAAYEFRNVNLPYLISSGLESTWVTATPATGDSVSTSRK